jgi:membrane fusion protein (multidrug efflux system)
MSQSLPIENNKLDVIKDDLEQGTVKGRGLFAIARIVLLVLLIGVMALWAAHWGRGAFLYVHETDARVMADLVAISAEVDGRVTQRFFDEGDAISVGQTLVTIDSQVMGLKLIQIKAERSTYLAELARVKAEYGMTQQQIASRIESAQSKLAEAKARKNIFVHEFFFLEKEMERVQKLTKSGAISRSKFDRVQADFFKAKQELIKENAAITTANSALNEVLADRSELSVKNAERLELEAQLIAIDAEINIQTQELENYTIKSRMNGVVGRRLIKSGEYVSRGQRLLVVHDPNKIWIETNIRETEINRISLGQNVRVEVDAFPDKEFFGKVRRIGNAATSQFALLPKLNEAGTFTKITQRIRVHVDVKQENDMLKPGMMVEVFIDPEN